MAAAPAQASAVGYNVQTFGPNVTIGSNWFRFAGGVDVTQNANGSVTIRGGNNAWGQQLQTALPTSGTTFRGTVFSDGGYFEATMSFTGNPSISGGWPSFWMKDIEIAENNGSGSLAQWRGQAAGYNRWSTINIAEWADDHKPMSSPNIVFHDFHDFYGFLGRTWRDADTGYHDNGSPYTLPVDFDLTQLHRYGFLWVPATATSRGFARFYIDGNCSPRYGHRLG